MATKDGARVITGSIIKITATPKGGSAITIGRAMNLGVSESYSVRPIYGIGNVNPQELPVLQWSGSLSVGIFAIPSKDNILGQFTKQGTVTQVVNNLLFNEGVDIVISRRVKPDSTAVESYVDVASINGCICTNENIEISEGAVVTRSGQFVFASPISYL